MKKYEKMKNEIGMKAEKEHRKKNAKELKAEKQRRKDEAAIPEKLERELKLLAKLAKYRKLEKRIGEGRREKIDREGREYVKKYNEENIHYDIDLESGEIVKLGRELYYTEGGWKEGKRWCITKTEWQKRQENQVADRENAKREKIKYYNIRLNGVEESNFKREENFFLMTDKAAKMYNGEVEKKKYSNGRQEITVKLYPEKRRVVKIRVLEPALIAWDREEKIIVNGKIITVGNFTDVVTKMGIKVYKVIERVEEKKRKTEKEIWNEKIREGKMKRYNPEEEKTEVKKEEEVMEKVNREYEKRKGKKM